MESMMESPVSEAPLLGRFTRWQAAAVHLLLSAAIAVAVLGVMFLLWYPRPYFTAAGGMTLLLLIVGVDVVIGPILTLIVYDPRKKYLALDLAVIATLQVLALAYGAWIMFQARPVYVAFAGDRFELVSANEIAAADLDKAPFEYRSLPVTGPEIVGTKLPSNPFDLVNLGVASLMGGSIGLFPQYYVPYSTVASDVAAKAQPLTKLRQRHAAENAEIDAVMAKSGQPESALRFLPLQSKRASMTVFVDANGKVVDVAAIDPW